MNREATFRRLIEEGLATLSFTGVPAELYLPMEYIVGLGGKRMRPFLTLLACDLFGGNIEEALPAALGIELFHNFSLVHDDIMDQAPLRRNQSTVHTKWNTNIAILSGDALLIKAIQQFEKLPRNLMADVLPVFNATALQVCEGQQFDMNYEKSNEVSIAGYLRMIELKTAVLLAASLKIGALIGNASVKDAELLYDFGRNIGIAFQLQDDLLDVYGDPKKFGKQTGGDIIANKKTFLLLKALEISLQTPSRREELIYWISSIPENNTEKVEGMKNIYNEYGVQKFAYEEMNACYEKGFAALDKVEGTRNDKMDLYNLVEKLRVREL